MKIFYCFALLIAVASTSTSAASTKWQAPRRSQKSAGEVRQEDAEARTAVAEMLAVQQRLRSQSAFHVMEKQDNQTNIKEVCYGELGCFSNEFPWNNAFNFVPNAPTGYQGVNTSFRLYTRDNPTDFVQLEIPPGASSNWSNAIDNHLVNVQFQPRKETKFIIHGFGSKGESDWVIAMSDAFLGRDDVNVVRVDWADGALSPNYPQAAANTRIVGTQTAQLMAYLRLSKGASGKFHCIGHSLGAHTCGLVGQELQIKFGLKLDRIVGMDPAEPFFSGVGHEVRVDHRDADFVEIIHSNGASIFVGGAGLYDPTGHVDVYPNGGRTQPGCELQLTSLGTSLINLNFGEVVSQAKCSHERACHLYIESISGDCPFESFECPTEEDWKEGKCFPCSGASCQSLGDGLDTSARGLFYLNTPSTSPYCGRHHYSISVAISGESITYGMLEVEVLDKDSSTWFNITRKSNEKIEPGTVKASIELLSTKDRSVKDISAVNVRYVKNVHWFWAGRDQVQVTSVTVADKSDSVCFEGKPVTTGVPEKLALQCRSRVIMEVETESAEKTFGDLRATITDNAVDIVDVALARDA